MHNILMGAIIATLRGNSMFASGCVIDHPEIEKLRDLILILSQTQSAANRALAEIDADLLNNELSKKEVLDRHSVRDLNSNKNTHRRKALIDALNAMDGLPTSCRGDNR